MRYAVVLRGEGVSGSLAREAALFEVPEPFPIACEVKGCIHPIAIHGKYLCCMTCEEIDNVMIELAQLEQALADTT